MHPPKLLACAVLLGLAANAGAAPPRNAAARIRGPWWSFSPERADYIARPSPVIGDAVRPGIHELYVWSGLKARARGYHVFLQGQFRDSEVEVDADRLERMIGEAWLGLTWQFSQDSRLSYVVRYQTREIEDGPASRGLLWSGFVFSRDL